MTTKSLLRYCIYITVFLLPFGPRFAFYVGNVYSTTVFLLLITCLWVLTKSSFLEQLKTSLGRAIFFFVYICLILTSIHFLTGLAGTVGFLKVLQFLEYAFLYFITIDVFDDEKQIRKLVHFFLTAVLLEAIIAIIHYHYPLRIIKAYYTLESSHFSNQMIGTFSGEHNLFMSYILSGLLILIAFIFKTRTRKKKILLFMPCLLLFYALLFSMSRTAYITFLGGFLLLLLLDKKLFFWHKVKRYVLIIIAVTVLASSVAYLAFLEEVKQRAISVYWEFSQSGVSLEGRTLGVWNTVMQVASFEYPLRSIFGFGSPAGVIHNSFARMLYQTGIVGFVFFIWLCSAMFRSAYNAFEGSVNESVFVQSFLLGFVVVLLSCFFAYSFSISIITIYRVMGNFWIFLGLISVYELKIKPARDLQYKLT